MKPAITMPSTCYKSSALYHIIWKISNSRPNSMSVWVINVSYFLQCAVICTRFHLPVLDYSSKPHGFFTTFSHLTSLKKHNNSYLLYDILSLLLPLCNTLCWRYFRSKWLFINCCLWTFLNPRQNLLYSWTISSNRLRIHVEQLFVWTQIYSCKKIWKAEKKKQIWFRMSGFWMQCNICKNS